MSFVSKRLLKSILRGVSLFFVVIPALLCGFGRWKTLFTTFAHSFAMIPGIVGDHLRIAFYHLTLQECSLSSRISFGSFFAHPEAVVAPGVYIGSYSILGVCTLGARSQIASGVHILSGKKQHVRGESGEIQGAESGEFSRVSVGANCWIGAAAIVMADVGEGTTVGAGAIVTKPLPPNCVAVGNPARVVKTTGSAAETSLTEA